jgi:hypothetical protein
MIFLFQLNNEKIRLKVKTTNQLREQMQYRLVMRNDGLNDGRKKKGITTNTVKSMLF